MAKGINLSSQEIGNFQNNYHSNNIQHFKKPWLFFINRYHLTNNNWQKSDGSPA
ncbi:MAG: hypothetical protein O4861_01565 [Trichodesmium sp. St16_bin4-tuft]|nr:hypothetical protein [Trichodesmium sp. MAG_R01]MDE5068632.1 hypothetical protein [Trichodesmium sp. St4_bin8_1]MDE5071754.1 hypothetical protein [Trichodesmium sp. St5_bin8]MDE5079000.1 hypothetical protein [Trichodesmium sp. St2_bin6]MDE5090917.1 hypothetical protein [Trichodesmium sp. St18_bin3_1_1]MDE5097094.1 hypothetical protein [Trichodesmium sp. St16_bin4-tuft]MDE5105024.1 hypothetical protein [Trichodesmium sp. St19_bin2]